jgi:hypothetical protein
MESIAPLWLWVVFVVFVVAALFVDFVVLKKQGSHAVGVKEALNWSFAWVALSLLFNGLFWWAVKDSTGSSAIATEKSLEFLTGYLIEKSLAVDNIFVFLLIFSYFAVPAAFQKRVLMIGILGAIVLRTVMILVGGWLLAQFHWILYVFGAFLVLTGVKMWWAAGQEPSLDENPALKLLRRVLPVSKGFDGEKFFTVENGKRIVHAAAHGDLPGRLHRRDLRGRLHPGHLRGHARPVHRADQQRVRHPGPARHVLPAAGRGEPLSPAQLRAGADPGLHRHQDAADRHLQDPGRGGAGRGAVHPGRHHALERAHREGLTRQSRSGTSRSISCCMENTSWL